ncbi:hypothetical protein LOZ53_004539 [Ophidiomyces ophidiicola]|nr:hypothetical protein LOZ55_001690 [Ophidiomyces ophidiicola]KAI1984204.1 hypothetical protein LOZ54_004640 [Ophidiomyces ophidiicola]KAI1986889.1 hypothetical protein LOZ53_004539 [Ophidiomyces ophidiicola]KAI1994548.1 hypothetical protein LOZ51_003742 [Ophidiomyces ophidiicola]
MPLPTSVFEALDGALHLFKTTKPLIPTYIHLVISALFCIYIGAHASLSRPSSAAKPAEKEHKGEESEDNEDSDDEQGMIQKMEGLEPSDAIMFPILSALTLGGLYFLLKHFDPAILNKVINWYFSHAGLVFATAFVKDGLAVLKSLVFPRHYSSAGSLWKVGQEKRVFTEVSGAVEGATGPRTRTSPLPGIFSTIHLPQSVSSGLWHIRGAVYGKALLRGRIGSLLDIKARFTILDALSIIIALSATGYSVFVGRPWWLINFLGFSFSYGALQFLSPTTFSTGSLLLGALFFYDIYFVFYTPMMVTVAKKLDVPVKLLFPRPPSPKDDPNLASLAMLGLGDIVVPGTIIGLALRFDLYLHYLRQSLPQKENEIDIDRRPRYLSATGGWGERLWTKSNSSLKLPVKETSFHKAKSFRKTYFNAGMTGYLLGMLATLIAMQISNQPQPALLYLVPGVLSAIWTAALINGDISAMCNFSDGVTDEDDEAAEVAQNTDKEKTLQEQEQGTWVEYLRNLIFGSPEPVSARGKGNRTGNKLADDENESVNKKDRKTKELKSRELVYFSISLPPKRGNKGSSPSFKAEFETGSESLVSIPDSGLSSPVIVEDVEENPVKKRRTR